MVYLRDDYALALPRNINKGLGYCKYQQNPNDPWHENKTYLLQPIFMGNPNWKTKQPTSCVVFLPWRVAEPRPVPLCRGMSAAVFCHADSEVSQMFSQRCDWDVATIRWATDALAEATRSSVLCGVSPPRGEGVSRP